MPKTGQRTPHGVEERSMGGAVRSPDVAAPGSRSDAGSLVLVQFEGLSGQKIIELLNLNGRREEWRIEVVGCQLQILVEHFLNNLVEALRKELKAEVMVASFNFLLSNSSRVLPRSEDEGKKKNLTKELKKMKAR
ncbi:hypothetical protein TRIUR3_14845 [Triticum urartu]|uniref:Uncharacterized protein n=1 Tax=Triticum urartu TaxID=4572 RepID=M7ZP62_TRIUA|nr:hypothetical protein TRIUR3_14845 [Triticum urartu]